MLNEQEQEALNARAEAVIADGEQGEFPVAWQVKVGRHVAQVVYMEGDFSENANPREGDQLGTMICWHPDYILGDEQIVDGGGGGAVENAHEHSGRFRSIGTLARYCRIALNAPVVLPLYLYDHSGISMRAGAGLVIGETPSGGYDEFGSPRGWDTTLCGVIYTTPERVRELCGECSDCNGSGDSGGLACARCAGTGLYVPDEPEWYGRPHAWLAEQLKQEVALYDAYLRGEVYGWRVLLTEAPEDPDDDPNLRDAEHVDSCWCYLPDVSERHDRELHYIQFEAVDAALSAENERIEAEKNEAIERARAAAQDIATVQA